MNDSLALINLNSLFDLSATLNSSDDDIFILNASLLSVMGKLRTFTACALVSCGEDRWEIAVSKGKKLLTESVELKISEVKTLGFSQQGEQTLIEAGYRIILPAMYKDETLAMICLGGNLSGGEFSDEELQYFSLVGTIMANALMNARNYRSLTEAKRFVERKNQLLTTLFEISREFTTLLDPDKILRAMTFRLMGQLMVNRFALFAKNSDRSIGVSLNRLKISPSSQEIEHLSEISSLFNIRQDATASPELLEFLHKAEILLLVPMKVQNETKYWLAVGEKLNKQAFSEEDEHFLEALANTAVTSLENARLFKEELAKKRLEDELNIARTIQRQLLPTNLPPAKGFDYYAMNLSSKQVGGDYYDIIPLSADEVLFVIADVSGKGMPASLLMANTQAALRVLAPLELPLTTMVARVNDLLFQNTASDKFVTFFCGKLQISTGIFTYCNAGHNPPMLLRADNSIELLSEGGLILGIMETLIPYSSASITLTSGDLLFLYTDGVSEALNTESEEFTEQRMEVVLREQSSSTAQEIVSAMLEHIQKFAEGAPQSDDITMISLKKLG